MSCGRIAGLRNRTGLTPAGVLLALLAADAEPQERPYGLVERQTADLQVASAGPGGKARLQPAFQGLSFTQPIYLTHAGDGSGRVFVVERPGTIRVFRPGDETTRPFLDIVDRVIDFRPEIGLLGLAFHPGYRSNGRFYVYYIARGLVSRLAEFRVSSRADSADAASERILLEVQQPDDTHNGGQLAFGPDGYLYWGLGDGANPDDVHGHAQDRRTLLGAILRLDVDGAEPYGVPPDNPFVGNGQGWREEIWAWGLRNPWRFSFDRATGLLWAGDVGQDHWEEIDLVEKGGNYGWNIVEGPQCLHGHSCDREGLIPPVWSYDHSQGRSIIGGYVYRGRAAPALQGLYIYGDFGTGWIWGLEVQGGLAVENRLVAASPGQISSFGEDEGGELYVINIDGQILRLEKGPEEPRQSHVPALLSDAGVFTHMASLDPAPGLIPYAVNAPLWSDGAGKDRWLALPDTSRIHFAVDEPWVFPNGTVLVKNFYLPGEGAGGRDRIIETRLLVKRTRGEVWDGFSYEWNEAGTQATLLEGRARRVFEVPDPAAPLGRRRHEHRFPSRSDCIACHTPASGYVLGLRTAQMNRIYDYGAAVDHQLRSFNHIGLFTEDIGEDYHAWPRLPDPLGKGGSVAERARAYLDANCSHCHRPGGGGRTAMDLRYDTPLDETGLTRPASLGDLGLTAALRVAAGAPERSVLYRRMLDLDRWRMPPVASGRVDREAAALIHEWIASHGGTVVEEQPDPPAFELAQNYPNPFNGKTVLSYRLSRPGPVAMTLYGINGQVVRHLVNEAAAAGKHRVVWDGRDAAGRMVASGVYFARLQVGTASRIRKLLLLR